MFCSKCGTRVADDDYACYMCGSRLNNNVRSALEILLEEEEREAALEAQRAEELKRAWKQAHEERNKKETVISEDPIEATVREMFSRNKAEFEAEDNEDLEYIHTLIGDDAASVSSGKRSRVPFIVIGAISFAAVIGVLVFLLRDRPAAEPAEEAAVIRDIDRDEGIIEKIPVEEEKEEEEVKVSMIGRVRELRDSYLIEEAAYDEVVAEFDILKDSVYDDIDEFNEINEQIERINASRLVFEKAEKSYERGEYPDAVSEYKEVLEEDERYYERAQEGIDKCNDAVRKTVEGKWRYEYDARKEVGQYVKEKGFNLDLSKMKIPIYFLFDLNADGSIKVTVDYDALNEYIDKVLDLAVEAMAGGVETNLPGNSDITAILKNMYSSSGMKDKIKEQLNIQEALDNLLKESGVDKIDSFTVEDGHLYIGTACMDVSFEEETLTLSSETSEALAVGHYKMPYPIKMLLVEKGKEDEASKPEKTTEKSDESTGDKKGN